MGVTLTLTLTYLCLRRVRSSMIRSMRKQERDLHQRPSLLMLLIIAMIRSSMIRGMNGLVILRQKSSNAPSKSTARAWIGCCRFGNSFSFRFRTFQPDVIVPMEYVPLVAPGKAPPLSGVWKSLGDGQAPGDHASASRHAAAVWRIL